MTVREEAVAAIASRLATTLGKDASEFTADSRFEDLALKSVNYSQLTTHLEDAFDVEVSYMEFRRRKTIGEAADYIESLAE